MGKNVYKFVVENIDLNNIVSPTWEVRRRDHKPCIKVNGVPVRLNNDYTLAGTPKDCQAFCCAVIEMMQSEVALSQKADDLNIKILSLQLRLQELPISCGIVNTPEGPINLDFYAYERQLLKEDIDACWREKDHLEYVLQVIMGIKA